MVYTYFHFASDRPLTEAMIKSGAVCLAYETVEEADHSLPLLRPMSEVAGRMAILNEPIIFRRRKAERASLISGVPGVKPTKVLVLGGGTVGEAAARMAAGMGADVVITDISLPRLRRLSIEPAGQCDDALLFRAQYPAGVGRRGYRCRLGTYPR